MTQSRKASLSSKALSLKDYQMPEHCTVIYNSKHFIMLKSYCGHNHFYPPSRRLWGKQWNYLIYIMKSSTLNVRLHVFDCSTQCFAGLTTASQCWTESWMKLKIPNFLAGSLRAKTVVFLKCLRGMLFSRSATIRVNRHDDSYLVAVLSVCHCIVSAYISTQ